MFPIYNLNGKSAIYLNGKKFKMFCKAFGISGIGINIPPSRAENVCIILQVPFGEFVLKVKATAIRLRPDEIKAPMHKLTINKSSAIQLTGIDKPIFLGSREAIINIGINLSIVVEIF